MNDERITEVLMGSVWKTIPFKNIKKGNFFRLFEPDGTQVFGDGLSYMYEAVGDAYAVNVDEEDTFTVSCIPVDPIERGLEIEEYVVR